jgi:hypothetical protein
MSEYTGRNVRGKVSMAVFLEVQYPILDVHFMKPFESHEYSTIILAERSVKEVS